jgi:RNase P subunit RPR2
MGRRGIKEYRPAEALVLIAADRDHKMLVCPSCNTPTIERNPRESDRSAGRVTMTCTKCGRVASYLLRASLSTPEEPRKQ